MTGAPKVTQSQGAGPSDAAHTHLELPATPPTPATRLRLDRALLSRGLARSRTHAAQLIAQGYVIINGRRARKPSTPTTPDTTITVTRHTDWASRAAHKLLGALQAFDIDPADQRAVDAGASHGGFTQVLLRAGAATVAAIDVGEGQLAPYLAADRRVHVFDRTNLRYLEAEPIIAALGGPADIVVADVSFISLTLLLPALTAVAGVKADIIPMVKPQFEVGKGRHLHHGVVRDPAARLRAVMQVAEAAASLGWYTVAAAPSPLPGPSGNKEYFLHLRCDQSGKTAADMAALIHRAVDDHDDHIQ